MKRVHYLSSLLIAAFICSGICIAADNQITVAGSSTEAVPQVSFIGGGCHIEE